MKQKLAKVLVFGAVLFSVSSVASAQIYVRIHPVIPIVVRTERPSPDRVWIDEDWQESNGNYQYSGGHWATPPAPGQRWNQGHWRHGRHGDRWMRGSWSN